MSRGHWSARAHEPREDSDRLAEDSDAHAKAVTALEWEGPHGGLKDGRTGTKGSEEVPLEGQRAAGVDEFCE